MAEALLDQVEALCPGVEFSDERDGGYNLTLAARVRLPATGDFGEEIELPGDMDGSRSPRDPTRGSPFGGLKTFDSRWGYSGMPDIDGPWTCSLSLDYNQGDRHGEVIVDCYQMR